MKDYDKNKESFPATYRFQQCGNSIVFKYFSEQYSNYLSEVFDAASGSLFLYAYKVFVNNTTLNAQNF